MIHMFTSSLFNIKTLLFVSLQLIYFFLLLQNVFEKRHTSQFRRVFEKSKKKEREISLISSILPEIFFDLCFPLFKKVNQDNPKTDSIFISVQKKTKSSLGKQKHCYRDTENFGLIPILEVTSDKESEKHQEFQTCNKLYVTATCERRHFVSQSREAM